MKKLKRLTAVVLAFCFISTCFSVQASAFGGYAHWFMGCLIAATSGESLTNQKIYASGCLLADIGATTWDKNKTPDKDKYASDKYIVVKKMYDLAQNSNYTEAERIFSYGWRDHYIQDQKGKVAKTNPPALAFSYRLQCGWIDEYLRDEIDDVFVDYPIQNNETNDIYISYRLIRDTYNALFGFSPGNEEILDEIKDMFAAYDLQIFFNVFGWSETDEENIAAELTRTIGFCLGINPGAPVDYSNRSSTYSSEVTYDTEKLNTNKNLLTDENLKILTDYIEIEETPISDYESYISISVDEPEKYANALNSICTKTNEAELK